MVQIQRLLMGGMDCPLVDIWLARHLPRVPPTQHQLGCTYAVPSSFQNQRPHECFQFHIGCGHFDSTSVNDMATAAPFY